MGVGKTAVSRELKKMLPKAVFLDGDWCWDMAPFVVNDETKAMVMDNICACLNRFLKCGVLENIIFCWVMHEQSIIDEILSRLDLTGCAVEAVSLTCSEEELRRRLQKDIDSGIRTPDILDRSAARLPLYKKLNTRQIDTTGLDAKEAAYKVVNRKTVELIEIEEIPVEHIDEFWKIHLQYLLDDEIITDEEDKAYFQSDEYRNTIKRQMLRPVDRHHMVYFVRGGVRIGAAQYNTYQSEGGKCYILDFWVFPEFRGNGTGHRCFTALEAATKAWGATSYEINCVKENAHRFWQSLGFEDHGVDEYGMPLMDKALSDRSKCF